MKDGLVSIELPKAGAAKPLAGDGVLDWRKRSIVHKAWLEEGPRPLLRKLRRSLLPKYREDSSGVVNHTQERHHNYNGRPWCLGRDHIEYLIRRGLKPEHYFLDLGCGAMRTGIWVSKYLDPERYFGIDAHYPGLEAAAHYEIPLHGLQEKKPRLLNSDQFDIDHFGVRFDWIFAFAVVNHLSDELFDSAFSRIHEFLKPTGRLILSPAPRKSIESIETKYGLRLCHSEETPCLLIDDKIDWFEFQPTTQGS